VRFRRNIVTELDSTKLEMPRIYDSRIDLMLDAPVLLVGQEAGMLTRRKLGTITLLIPGNTRAKIDIEIGTASSVRLILQSF
jgi:hypothetical protein